MGCVVLFHFGNENLTLPKKQPDHVRLRCLSDRTPSQVIHELNQLPPSPPHESSDDDDDLNQDFLPPNHNLENRNPN